MKWRLFTILSALSLLGVVGVVYTALFADGLWQIAYAGHGHLIALDPAGVTRDHSKGLELAVISDWKGKAPLRFRRVRGEQLRCGLAVGTNRLREWGLGVATTTQSGVVVEVDETGLPVLEEIGDPVPRGRVCRGGWTWWLRVEYFTLFCAFSILPVLWLFTWQFHHDRMLRRRKRGECIQCGYDLRASKERCPECGAAVPPQGTRRPGKPRAD